MYKQYLNDYEKRADQIRRAARAIETGESALPKINAVPENKKIINKKNNDPISEIINKFSTDDVLLLVLIFVLLSNEDRDMTLIIILGYLFLSGL